MKFSKKLNIKNVNASYGKKEELSESSYKLADFCQENWSKTFLLFKREACYCTLVNFLIRGFPMPPNKKEYPNTFYRHVSN